MSEPILGHTPTPKPALDRPGYDYLVANIFV